VDAWEKMKFNVIKYVKGNQDRGYVLGACDEVLQALDDHTMALQSMAGSRFIGPFLSTVQQWEKSLSLISEVCFFFSLNILCKGEKRILIDLRIHQYLVGS
jgi:dynein heavy chain